MRLLAANDMAIGRDCQCSQGSRAATFARISRIKIHVRLKSSDRATRFQFGQISSITFGSAEHGGPARRIFWEERID
jgi:hypothetical protein